MPECADRGVGARAAGGEPVTRFRRLVVEITDFLDTFDGAAKYSREVREDLTAHALLECFARGVLKWRTL